MPSVAAEPPPVGYVELVRTNRNFRRLWFGQIVSLLGDWFNLIATATLTAKLTGSGVAVGGLLAIRMLAVFFASPFAGVAADRLDRKTILIVTDLVRAVVVLGFLLVETKDDLWLLYALTCTQMALSGFFFPARRALLPDVTEPHELGTANALSSTTWSTMLAFGAGLGGVVAGLFGVTPAFVIDAATFVLSALVIATVRPRPGPAAGARRAAGAGVFAAMWDEARGALRVYLDGLRYLVRDRDVLAVSLHKPANALFVKGAFGVVQVMLAREVFVYGEDGSLGLGALYACIGLGSGVAPLVVRRWTGDRARALQRAMGVAYLVSAAGLAAVGAADAFWLVLVGATLRGAGGGTVWVFSTQLLLVLVPNEVRGRVFSTEFAFMTLGSAAGAFLGGAVLDAGWLSVSGLLFAMAALTLVPFSLWTAWLARLPGTARAPEPIRGEGVDPG